MYVMSSYNFTYCSKYRVGYAFIYGSTLMLLFYLSTMSSVFFFRSLFFLSIGYYLSMYFLKVECCEINMHIYLQC